MVALGETESLLFALRYWLERGCRDNKAFCEIIRFGWVFCAGAETGSLAFDEVSADPNAAHCLKRGLVVTCTFDEGSADPIAAHCLKRGLLVTCTATQKYKLHLQFHYV